MNKKITFFIALLLLSLFAKNVFGQAPVALWAKSFGNMGFQGIRSISVDASGNVFAVGEFNGTVDFDPGAGVFNLTGVTSYNCFVSKFDSVGNFTWAKAINGIGARSITLDYLGNIFITGSFNNVVDFDPGPQTFILNATGNDVFICKLDNDGSFIWAKAMNCSASAEGVDIETDLSGHIYVGGDFSGTTDFDPDTSGIYNLNSVGLLDLFIGKLDSVGNLLWVKRSGGINDEFIYSIALDSAGNVYATGEFDGTADFDPDPSINFYLTSLANRGGFVYKIDNSGHFVWAKASEGAGHDRRNSIAVDAAANIYTTGYFAGAVDFDPGVDTVILNFAGTYDIFICKYNTDGNLIWAKSIGGPVTDWSYSIITDPGNMDIYIAGLFGLNANLDPGPGAYNLTSVGWSDIFISRLDSSGNFISAKGQGGTGNDYATSIALGIHDNVFLGGYFFSPVIQLGPFTLLNFDSTTTDALLINFAFTTTGIENLSINENVISVFPNPANELLVISYPLIVNRPVTINITDISGKIIYSVVSINKSQTEINTIDYPAGIYLVQIQSDDFIQTKKLIVSK